MTDSSSTNQFQSSLFMDHMAGGAYVCRASKGHELLYANENLIRLFECDDYEDFVGLVGNSYDGMVTPAQLSAINKELDLQITEQKKTSGHLFYHIRTKTGNLHLVEEHWSLVQDETEGALFYVFVVSREFDNSGSDYDPVTGLYGKNRFHKFVMSKSRNCDGSNEEYAVAYLNFVNFKLLNINQGIAEGDACLRTIADILSMVFEDAFLARLSDDHFAIFTKYEDILSKTEEFNRQFHDSYGSRYDVIGKCGIYHYRPSKSFDVEAALSYAKVACDYIKYDEKIDIVEYSDQLAKRMMTSEHVTRKLDEALEKGWIQVYYQPVVRSITGQLCGVESLVRWKDPELGFIMPGDFIKTLEDNRQIHKLDSYVVDKVCQCIQDRVAQKQPAVPVSVNFSRLDFAMCDMLRVVEQAVEKYDVPRDFIHIEVTESMIASDEELMRKVIGDFRQAGYEIWMDDFGSGYSSLTLLKDYQFDMLKLDMRFLTPFTDKAKDIMRHTITMAKDIGIKTLAEGVETKEQLDFLREIGCGQIQGYYYGKPEPVEEMFLHLNEKGISVEKRKWRRFYQAASQEVRATDMPLEIIEDDGKQFRTLFMNRPYRRQIFENTEMSLEEIDRRIYATGSPLLKKYREFADQIEESGKPAIFYYTQNGNYLCLRVEVLAKSSGHYIIKGSLLNMTLDKNASESERLDARLRDLNLLFEVVLSGNIQQKSVFPLLGNDKYLSVSSDTYSSRLNDFIIPTERERYRSFTDFATLRERVEESRKGYIVDVFRVRQEDGDYRSYEVYLMMIPGTGGEEYLYCMKPYLCHEHSGRDGVERLLSAGSAARASADSERDYGKLLWENMLCFASVKFFWKDRERRFLGASQSFLDYYGIKSLEEILGKTDEEMNWHVDDAPYQNDEWDVLRKGVTISDAPGQCIVNGVIHNIACFKRPIYDGGEIVGLMGYFVDKEDKSSYVRKRTQTLKRDGATGLMNARAMVESMVDYAMQYHNRGRNYGLILVQNCKHARIVETYDEKFANDVLREMGSRISKLTGHKCLVARTKDSVFAVLSHVRVEKDFYELASRIREGLEGINEVEGNPVTMRIRMSVKVRTHDRVTDENIYDSALQEITEEM